MYDSVIAAGVISLALGMTGCGSSQRGRDLTNQALEQKSHWRDDSFGIEIDVKPHLVHDTSSGHKRIYVRICSIKPRGSSAISLDGHWTIEVIAVVQDNTVVGPTLYTANDAVSRRRGVVSKENAQVYLPVTPAVDLGGQKHEILSSLYPGPAPVDFYRFIVADINRPFTVYFRVRALDGSSSQLMVASIGERRASAE